ncbi:hypothetical protein OROGR_012247 [Orobanche gracilis]
MSMYNILFYLIFSQFSLFPKQNLQYQPNFNATAIAITIYTGDVIFSSGLWLRSPFGVKGIIVFKMCKVPSLVDLCIQMAIDNVRHLGDVGETDYHLLDRILSHCTLDQLMHIENRTEGRDLSPVTDKLWKKFYNLQFGVDSTNIAIERMRKRKVTYKWRQLYENYLQQAKVEEREEATQNSLERIKLRYQEEDARKRSRQLQLCSKVPPSSKKRSPCGGVASSIIYNTKSSLMKKAKLEFINSREMKNIAAMKNKVVPKNQSVSSTGKPHVTFGLASSSSSSKTKLVQKRL